MRSWALIAYQRTEREISSNVEKRYCSGVAIIPASGQAPPHEAIERAAQALDSGYVVAVPTDTIYALVADVSYTGAADRLFALKRRNRNHELPVLVADAEQALEISYGVPVAARRLMDKLWPGPLTIVVPRNPDFVADLGADDDETVGVRCPDHVIPRLLCEEVGPLAVTSAHRNDRPPSMSALEVSASFGSAVSVILDGGVCDGDMATVVDVTGETPKLLREGQIPWSDVEASLG